MGLFEFQDIKHGLPQTITGHSIPSACNVCETMMWLRTDDGCQTEDRQPGPAQAAGPGDRRLIKTVLRRTVLIRIANVHNKYGKPDILLFVSLVCCLTRIPIFVLLWNLTVLHCQGLDCVHKVRGLDSIPINDALFASFCSRFVSSQTPLNNRTIQVPQ